MKNSDKYFNNVAGFIEDMAEISAAYDKEVKRLVPFEGSEGYTRGMKAAQDQREADVRRMKEIYLKQFQEVTSKMREAVNNRPLIAPTPEQAALLSTLQMRSSLGQDELERAAKQMDGCPIALSVLDDLAKKHEVRGVRFNQEMSAEYLRGKIDTLDRMALELIREGVVAANRTIPKDAISCMERYGCFWQVPKQGASAYGDIASYDVETDVQTINAFCEAVN